MIVSIVRPKMLLVKDFFIFPRGCTEGLSLRAEGKVRSVARGQQRERAHSGGGAGAGDFAHQSPVCRWRAMVGPTGESNFYAVLPRGVVLCLTYDDIQRNAHLMQQLAAVLAVGGRPFAAPRPPRRDRSSASSSLRLPVSKFRWNTWCLNAC